MRGPRASRNKPVLIRNVNFWYYPLTLLPVLALFFGAAYGYVHPFFGLLGLFLLLFWLSSLAFALYATFRKPKDPRQ